MKELSIEQKANRYDKALEKSKRLYEQGTITESLAYIFPELKESEEEKTRKEIVEFLKKNLHLDWAIWLEKQGKQKSADKVEPTAWSEEDEYYYGIVQYILNNECVGKADRENATTWLKSIKNRVQPQNSSVTDEELAQAKKEAYNEALDKIEYNSGEPTFDDGWSAAIWYLKKRNGKPQNRWKPSDKQMEVLWKYAEQNNYDGMLLTSLYNDLKKLRKE